MRNLKSIMSFVYVKSKWVILVEVLNQIYLRKLKFLVEAAASIEASEAAFLVGDW